MKSASLLGTEALPVSVEVAVMNGIPGMAIVGMADTAVQEARERVKAAIKSSGYSMPTEKIVINLAPGDIRKVGSGFDLPIALGILVASGQVDRSFIEGRMFVGELSLTGDVKEVHGTLAYAICASKMGLELVTPSTRRSPIKDLPQKRISSLRMLSEGESLSDCWNSLGSSSHLANTTGADFSDIAGHDFAKRAMIISATGEHGLLMVGPPGSGKTMLASRIPSILPPLTEKELIESAAIHSVAGEDPEAVLQGIRPFRSPHHSATSAGLLGGGNPIRPGEASLAHCGVLFLDELAEFKSSTLQGLRQPVEQGHVAITRAIGSIKMPARFMLVAATNPCPCGYLGDRTHACSCTVPQVRKYQSRVGGPLIDRFDLQLDVVRLSSDKVLSSGSGTSSSEMQSIVYKGREFRSWRERNRPQDANFRNTAKSKLNSKQVIEDCRLDEESKRFLQESADSQDMSGRGIISVMRISRTIADIEESESVNFDHIAEALGYRVSEMFGAC